MKWATVGEEIQFCHQQHSLKVQRDASSDINGLRGLLLPYSIEYFIFYTIAKYFPYDI